MPPKRDCGPKGIEGGSAGKSRDPTVTKRTFIHCKASKVMQGTKYIVVPDVCLVVVSGFIIVAEDPRSERHYPKQHI